MSNSCVTGNRQTMDLEFVVRPFVLLFAAAPARHAATIAGRVLDAEPDAAIPATITIRACSSESVD
jgi:hypothetical protein